MAYLVEYAYVCVCVCVWGGGGVRACVRACGWGLLLVCSLCPPASLSLCLVSPAFCLCLSVYVCTFLCFFLPLSLL